MRDVTPRRPAREVEQEAASRLSAVIRNEFGLTPKEASATLDGRTLRVRMHDALTPMARVVALSPQGPQILDTVYALLLDASRARMHQVIARVAGRPVRRSEMALDITQGDVSFLFELDAGPDFS